MDVVVIPEGLAAMPPGAGLGTVLAGIELSRVRNDQILQFATAQYRQLCHEQARMAAVMVELGRCEGGVEPGRVARLTEPDLFASDEIRAALRWTRRAAECEHQLAETVVHELPGVHAAWLAGEIGSWCSTATSPGSPPPRSRASAGWRCPGPRSSPPASWPYCSAGW